ncbi:hypothetical protein BHE74_00007088, partial [Ensete ventricosum]
CLFFCPYRESWKKRSKFLFSICREDGSLRHGGHAEREIEREGREAVEERTHASEFKEVEGVRVAFKSPDNSRRKTGCSINTFEI